MSGVIYIVPDSEESIKDWFVCPNNWMNEKGKQTITDWIIENKEIFGLETSQ